ncbi:MAG: hypothetical protein B6I26_01180 [Desulfobacteraceae bacterium 4572_130]|nr:MAG: hypothetical protein B6I26_01180 [Desulfobacteraceae bacterium 4572_130]
MKNPLKILLFVSFAINMFLIGFFVQGFLNKKNIPPRFSSLSCPSFLGNSSSKDIKKHVKKIRTARKEIFDALTKEPFDKLLIKEKCEYLRKEHSKKQKIFHNLIIDFAEKLPAQERLEFFKKEFFKKKHFPKHRNQCKPLN